MKFSLLLLLITLESVTASADSIRIGVPNPIISLEPTSTTNAQERFLLPLLFQPLFYIDQNGSIRPTLAENYEETKKGTVKIKIKADQYFSDGSRVTANDVVNSVNALCGKGSYNLIPIRTLIGCEKNKQPRVRLLSSREVEFKISGSINYFLYELASPFLFIFKNTPSGIIGSGEFKKKSLNQADAVIERVKLKPGMPSELDLIYIKEKDVTDNLNRGKIDIASMYVERDIKTLNVERFKKISTSNDIVTLITLNPKRLSNVPSDLLVQISDELKNDSTLTKCDVSKISAYGIVPEGIGGYLYSSPRENPHRPIKLIHKLELNLHVASDRLVECEIASFTRILADHNIIIKMTYDKDYNKLKLMYGTDKIDGYLEHFVFYTRDAGRFFSRFTQKSNAPVFYIQSKKIEKLLKDAENVGEIYSRFEIYRKINNVIEGYRNLFPLNYMAHSIVWNQCIGFKDSSDNIPTNPNTFLFLSDAIKTKCDGQ